MLNWFGCVVYCVCVCVCSSVVCYCYCVGAVLLFVTICLCVLSFSSPFGTRPFLLVCFVVYCMSLLAPSKIVFLFVCLCCCCRCLLFACGVSDVCVVFGIACVLNCFCCFVSYCCFCVCSFVGCYCYCVGFKLVLYVAYMLSIRVVFVLPFRDAPAVFLVVVFVVYVFVGPFKFVLLFVMLCCCCCWLCVAFDVFDVSAVLVLLLC